MNSQKISLTNAIFLSSAALLASSDIYSFNKHHVAIGGITTIATSALYGHLILPWYTNKRQEEQKRRAAANHAREQEQWRSFYRTMNGKYNAAKIPIETSQTLFAYKNQLVPDITALEAAINFDWDDKAEREMLIKLSHYLKDHASQVTKLIGLKVGQETHELYKDELALLAKEGSPDANNMSKIVYEKFGDTTFKFTSYKSSLLEAITHCKQLGAPQEMVQALENLNKSINFLFTNALDQERTARENLDKQEKLFKAELENKYAIKDFYHEAQHHVQQASNTVSRFSEEMDRQCKAQRTTLDSCSAMLQNIMNMFTTWGVHSEQQIERVVHEVRQEGRTTRDTVHTSVNAKTTAIERKIDAIERKANEAKKDATEAKGMANAALPPLPPATAPGYQPELPDDLKPTAPPQE